MAQVTKVSEFSLKWNNHHNALISVLDSLLEREELVDVTLAAEGQFVNAHRFVLYACSQYFEDLLCQQPGKSAVIFLKDVRFSDLKALVEYMYKGEVNVAEEQLTHFLETAKALKIKGLADGNGCQEPAKKVGEVQVIHNNNQQSAPIVEAPEMHFEVQIENSETEAVEPNTDYHSDSASVTQSPEVTAKRKRGRPKGKPTSNSKGGPLLQSKRQKGLLPFVCEYCGHSYRKESALSFHQRRECGKEPNLICSVEGCPYRSKRKADIKRHWKTIHEPDELLECAAST